MKNTYKKYKKEIRKLLVELILSAVVLLLLWGFYWRVQEVLKKLFSRSLRNEFV